MGRYKEMLALHAALNALDRALDDEFIEDEDVNKIRITLRILAQLTDILDSNLRKDFTGQLDEPRRYLEEVLESADLSDETRDEVESALRQINYVETIIDSGQWMPTRETTKIFEKL